MPKNRVIHTRIEEDLHNQIFDKCNELGCTVSEYITSTLESSLDQEVDEEPIEEIKEEPKRAEVTKWKLYDDDGNLVAQNPENS